MLVVGDVGGAIAIEIGPAMMPVRFAPVGRRRLMVLMPAMRMRTWGSMRRIVVSTVLGCHCSSCTVEGAIAVTALKNWQPEVSGSVSFWGNLKEVREVLDVADDGRLTAIPLEFEPSSA
jgi:hypothetical protein